MKSFVKLSMIAAMTAALSEVVIAAQPRAYSTLRKDKKKYPTMVTSSPEEIAAWNQAVEDKKQARLIAKRLARV